MTTTRREWWLAPLGFIAVTLVLYRRVFLGQWFGWDCPESFWPDLAFYAGSLRSGDWPLWNPFDRGGYPWAGDPHPGIYYPFTWLFVVPGAIAGEVPGWMMQAKALLHHALAGTFTYAYLRGRGLHWIAAAFAGSAVIVSAPMIVHKASALAWPMVWAPLVWLAIDRAVERAAEARWWRHAVLLGAVIAVAGCAGPPPGFFYILVASLLYGALRVAQHHRQALPILRTLAVAGVVTLALFLVTLLPQLDAMALSGRAQRTVAYAVSGGLEPHAVVRGLVTPWAGKVDSYMGALVVAFIAVALVRRPLGDRGAVLFFVVAGIGATLLSFGGHRPYLGFLVEHLPGFGLFREANRYKVLAALLWVIPAGHGVDLLIRDRRAAPLALGALALLALNGVLRGGAGSTVFFAVVAGAAVVCALAWWRPPFALALVPLAFFDVAWYAEPYVARSEPTLDDTAADRRRLEGLADVTRDWRVLDEFVMEQRPGSRLRIRDFRGYPAGDPYEDQRYQDILRSLDRNPELLEVYNVRYVLHGPHHRNGLQVNHLKRPPTVRAPDAFRRLDDRRWETLHPAPLAAWYGGVQVVAGKPEVLPALIAMREPDGTRRRAVVEAGDVPLELMTALQSLPETPPAPVPARVLAYQLDRVAVEIDAPAAGLVVLNEKAHRGWTLTIDGAAATPVRANYILRAAVVDAGRHVLEWRYQPPFYWPLLALWLAGVAVTALAAFRRA